MITEKELQDIREEAEKLYPPPQNEGEGFERYFQTMTRIRQYQRDTYIAAVTRERERVKPVIDSLELLVRACRGEELKWNEIKWAETALNNYKNNK